MSTSLLYHGWGLKGYRHVRSHYGGGKLIFTVQPNARSLTCPVCHGRDILHHGSIYRMWREVSIGSKPVFIQMGIPRIECRECSTIRQVKVGFADQRRTYTRGFERYALELSRHMTILGRGPTSECRLGPDQGHPKTLSAQVLLPAQAEEPATDRYRRDLHRQGPEVSDSRFGSGHRGCGLCRRWQRGRSATAVLAAAEAVPGTHRGSGHGHVQGLHQCRHRTPASGHDRFRSLPCDQAVQ